MRRRFQLLMRSRWGLAITLADIAEDKLRGMELIEAEKQEQTSEEDKDAKMYGH